MVTGISGENLCEISSCSPNPCGNGGTCQLDENIEGSYSCVCPEGYTGVDCMEDVDECLAGKWGSSSCLHTSLPFLHSLMIIKIAAGPCGPSGQCTNVPGFFQCTCTESTGNRCQYPKSCAEPDRCGQGQVCMESLLAPGGYVCVESGGEQTLVVDGVERDEGFLEDLLVNFRETLLQQVYTYANLNCVAAC